jgi:4-hydroxybenzoate polyprenyltransferase
LKSIITLIRLPNLIIIALTMYAFRYFVLNPYYGMSGTNYQIDAISFGIMVIVTMLIAIAGYVINDLNDIGIDRVNRPDRPSVNGTFSPGNLKGIAFTLSFLSFAGMLVLSFRLNSVLPLLPLSMALITVWWYALRLKKSLLWGNLAVAFMSSLTLGMAWLFEWYSLARSGVELYEIKPITQITGGIVVFAFLLSLMREIIKDAEDIEGDSTFQCKTLPITIGLHSTRKVLLIMTFILLGLLVLAQFHLNYMNFPMVIAWLLVAVEIPSLVLIFLVLKAKTKKDFHRLSTFVKWMMVGGISSMALIWLNFKF